MQPVTSEKEHAGSTRLRRPSIGYGVAGVWRACSQHLCREDPLNGGGNGPAGDRREEACHLASVSVSAAIRTHLSAHDRLKRHGAHLSRCTPKVGELQMDWLRSEDLKEEKVLTTPAVNITRREDGKFAQNRLVIGSDPQIKGGKENR